MKYTHGQLTSDTIIKLALLVVLVFAVVIGLTAGKLPQTFEDIRDYGNVTLALWDKLTGAKEKKLEEERHAQFLQVFHSLEHSFRDCLVAKRSPCWCHIEKDPFYTERYAISFQELSDQRSFVMIPQQYGKGEQEDRLFIAEDVDPISLPVSFCVVHDDNNVKRLQRKPIYVPPDPAAYPFSHAILVIDPRLAERSASYFTLTVQKDKSYTYQVTDILYKTVSESGIVSLCFAPVQEFTEFSPLCT